ncbi:MAG: hypothetical protein KDD70_19030, partial [Bdellovibrionales bacterium]|nr:hypothetical protein [Bdellovibrionales bacterium]
MSCSLGSVDYGEDMTMKALSKEASTQERKEVPRELSPMLICVLILVFCVTFSFARSGFAQDPTLTELRDVISAPGLETGELFFVVGRSEMAQYFLQSGVLPVSSAVCVNTPAEINNF